MTKQFGIEIKKARKDAGMTQEQAAASAERVRQDIRKKYEGGEILPGDDMVAAMMQVFNNPCLGYSYLSQESAVGRMILPKIGKIPGVAAGAMQYHVALAETSNDSMKLEKICCDDKIDATKSWPSAHHRQNICLAGRGLTLWLKCPETDTKKNRSAAAGTALKEKKLLQTL